MFLKRKSNCVSMSMRQAAEELAKDPAIRLIDVRTQEEFAEGHIPNSVNVPLGSFQQIARVVPNKDERLFVYCLSGSRSQMACGQLAQMGYADVTNIGGISQWPGKIIR
ncbi:MAG: rhodanese-like domain-containing protein [Oscillospiraceae bacterium]|nr:rhodanese-like domain-containing protein [Oscillospiraceae bacterium]